MAVSVYRGAVTKVAQAGVPVVALYGPMLSGLIVNPSTASDQGLDVVEVLYVDLVNAAAAAVTPTTIALQPGQYYYMPDNFAGRVSVNAASDGHRFSAYVVQPPVIFPPIVVPGLFPPDAPTLLAEVIGSYLYEEYRDDEDLQAFVDTFNAIAQQYVTLFANINLPIYTGELIVGDLLDWVAEGLYGQIRPALASGKNRNLGPLNTAMLNEIVLNGYELVGPTDITATTDDIFKRIITWNFSKIDDASFTIRWLKRRVARFLTGTNGVNIHVDQTYQISVTFGNGNQININLISVIRTLTGGPLNTFALNEMPLDSVTSTATHLAQLQNAAILAEAIESGVLLLPFQFTYVVNLR